jgi:uncharacterized protein YfiM (DUF2279 family)
MSEEAPMCDDAHSVVRWGVAATTTIRAQRVWPVFVLFLLWPAAALAQDQPQVRNSGWLSADKPRHFAISGTTTVLVTAVVDYAGGSENMALVAGITTSALIGATKEWLDQRAGRFVDPKDLVWDAAGIAVGAVLTRLIKPGGSAAPVVPSPPLPFLAEQNSQPAPVR